MSLFIEPDFPFQFVYRKKTFKPLIQSKIDQITNMNNILKMPKLIYNLSLILCNKNCSGIYATTFP